MSTTQHLLLLIVAEDRNDNFPAEGVFKKNDK